jgi:transposase
VAYSDDLRQKLLHAIDTQQGSQAALARIFGVSLSWLKGVVRRRRETGNCHALAHGGGQHPKLSATQGEELRQYVTSHEAVLLRELQAWLEAEHQVTMSLSNLSRLLGRMNLPRKKSRYTPPNAIRQPISRNAKLGAPR